MDELQNKACDIIEKLDELGYEFIYLLIPLICNYDGVAEYIVNNYEGDL